MKNKSYRFFLPVFLLGFLFGVMTPKLEALQEKVYRSLDIFTKVLFLVEKEYVEEVDGQDLIYGAVKGMLGTLDPYSVFLTPDVYKELKSDTVGRFGGVGLEVTLKSGVLTVVAPIEGTPAAKAGIRPGDRIVKIDGEVTKGMNLVDAVRKMRGMKKSKVTLTIFRKGQKKPFDVKVKRAVIKVKSVKKKELPSGVTYLHLTNFQEKSVNEVKKALKGLKSQSRPIIFDLRNNPGGLLGEAVDISNLFLQSGTIVSTKGRKGITDVQKANSEGDYFANPMVVLINQGSASASEILAAALKDNERAKLIGEKSFGKGSVQTVLELGDGTGLKLTIAKYYTPSGKSISGEGIEPNFVVFLPEDQNPNFENPSEDPQVQAAEAYLLTGKVPVVTPKTEKNKTKLKKEENQ